MSLAPSDLFLSPDLTEGQARAYLDTFGFRDTAAADEHLQAMADDLAAREAMGALAALLLDALQRVPDPDAALVGFSRYVATRYPKTMFLRYLVDDPRALGLLIDVLGTSPVLSEILVRNPEYLHWLAAQIDRAPPEAADLIEDIDGLMDREDAREGSIEALKRFRRRETLRITTRDILGLESIESATAQLSDLADVVTQHALRIAERAVRSRSGLERLPGRFAVLALGKLGGRELNYSSDIDLIFVYEPDGEEDQAAHELFQKLGRALVGVMTEFTDEGALYRVDLRLRPMGRRGNIAYSLRESLHYYDTWGETFERFALIKVRPIAGDGPLGRHFVERVQPFVYRRYLDHAALEEIFRYKERAEHASEDVDRDVKVGRGGIREIELFTQALLLTYGAGQPGLRQGNTLAALQALWGAGLVGEDIRDQLSRAYVFLRTVEHRLQIVQERQTHTLSRAQAELEICARRLGFSGVAALETEIEVQRGKVRAAYDMMFERRAGTSDFESRQFFRLLGEELSHADAVAFLQGYPLADPAAAIGVIRALDQATSGAARSTARNTLANLLAALGDRFPQCASPDHVLVRLARVIEGTGAPASFCRALLEHDALRNLLVATLDLGELPVTRLVRYPELLDSLLFTLPGEEGLRDRYRSRLSGVARDERFARIRRVKAVEEFKVLVEAVSDGSLTDLQRRLSLLADCCVAQAAEWAAPEPADSTSEWAIVALGRLGGRELTVHSDLDLVVIYRGDPADGRTFLERQRFVEDMQRYLEEPTGEGVAYQIDTRLRPEGRKGALAIPVGMFERYLTSRAEIWERLAWTRSRVVAGSESLTQEIDAIVRAFVYGPWQPRIPETMAGIRRRMERELGDPTGARLELKVGRGGLADVDFLLQMIQIREGHTRPAFRVPGTRQLLEQFPGSSLLTVSELGEIRRAHGFLRSLETFARVDSDTNASSVPADPGKLDALGRRLQMAEPAGEALLEAFQRETDRVRAIYEMVMERLKA